VLQSALATSAFADVFRALPQDALSDDRNNSREAARHNE
jgi:hypothetical protein